MLFTVMTLKKISSKMKLKPSSSLSNRTVRKTTSVFQKFKRFLNKKVETNLYHHKDFEKLYQKK